MLITDALKIAKSYELTHAQAQALVDLEAQVADFGYQMAIACRVCNAAHQFSECVGDSNTHDDGTMTFSVDCDCSKRAYRGRLRAPKAPRALRSARIDLTIKPEIPITRQEYGVFKDAADALHQLRLAYGMRCLACRLEGRGSDGVRGAGESNASQFVLECDCTRRVYKGADVALTH